MKILQVTPHYFPVYGGVEEVVRHYSERLVRNHKAEVTVLTAQEGTLPQQDEVNGVHLRRVQNTPEFVTQLHKLPRFPTVIKHVNDSLKRDPDVVHLHANKRFLTDVAAYFLTHHKRPFVFSPHAGQFGTSLLGKLHNKTLGTLAFRAQKVVVVSEFEKKLLAQHGFTQNISVLPNGIDQNEFKSVGENYLNHFKLEGKKKILFVGRFARSKGVDLFPEIAAKVVAAVPEVVFILAGHDAGEKHNLQARIQNLHLEKHFLLLEDLERDNLVSVYKNADYFLFPTRSEAFGVAVVEAMAAGLPIVASNNTAVPELIRDQENGSLAQTDNIDSFVAKLLALINNSKDATAFGKQAVKDSAAYDWDAIVARLYSLYQEVLA